MNNSILKIARTNKALSDKINSQGCCLTSADVPEVQKIDRMMLVLVRCGGGRFLCPIQDVQHFINIIGKEKSDYVRDVSFPSNA
jgi:hypothetical protein